MNGIDDGFFTKIFLKKKNQNPKNKINNCSSKRYRARKRNSGEAASWPYMLIIFCAEMDPSKMCSWQFTNPKWSKKVTVLNPALVAAFYFSLLQKAVTNMDADVKIETVWSFITWLSNGCKKYLLAAPVAIAPHVVMLAHLAGFGPQHFCKWKVLCVVY